MIHQIETTDPLLFCLQNPTKFAYIFLLSIYTMNYFEEDGLHAIKLTAEVYLREIRISLLLVWKCQHFSLEFLYYMQWVIQENSKISRILLFFL